LPLYAIGPQASHGIARLRYAGGTHAASLEELFSQGSQSVALDPKDALAHTALGLAFMEHRDYSTSLAEHVSTPE
jgi:hypothetical protein